MIDDVRRSVRLLVFALRVSMPSGTRRCCGLLVGLAGLGATAPAWGAASFTPLGLFGGNRSHAYDVSADGSVVAGIVLDTPTGQSVFRWNNGEVILRPASPIDGAAISGDGSVVVGSRLFPPSQAFRWTADGAFDALGDLPGGVVNSSATDISGDGKVIVGVGTTSLGSEAFRWAEETGMVGLGDLPGGNHRSVALGVSGDGSVIVGFGTDIGSSNQAFRWTAETGMTGLGRAPGADFSVARAISADASAIVGFNSFPGQFPSPRARAFRWTATEGMVSLSNLPDDINQSEANDVSADGSVIVGTGATRSLTGELQGGAFYWTASTGMINLEELLVSSGVTNLDGWSLTDALGVSADGLTVVGSAVGPTGQTQAFVATVPEPSTIALAALALIGVLVIYWRSCYRLRTAAAVRHK